MGKALGCYDDPGTPQSATTSADLQLFVLEMNHVEVYRGPETSHIVSLPPSDSGRYFFRVGRLNVGLSSGVLDASLVLPVRSSVPVLDFPYNATADVCDRDRALQA